MDTIMIDISSDTDLSKGSIIFISYLTVSPSTEDVHKYLENFEDTLLKNNNSSLWLLGKILESSDTENLPKQIKTFKSIKSLTSSID